MTQLTVRRLLVDLKAPVPLRWCGGDAFASAWLSALSMSFPSGEQFFIDAVRAGVKALPPERQAAFADEVAGFVGQEATHRHIHRLFNDHLLRQGLDNWIERNGQKRFDFILSKDVRIGVAATAAVEHFTAVFANWTMRHPEVLAACEPRLRTMWMWHAAEESEHRSTAYDVYQALGGDHAWRVKVFKGATIAFLSDVTRQTLLNLWHDKALFRWSTWRSAWRLLLSPQGMLRGNVAEWRDYLRPDFHPRQQDASLSERWLQQNPDAFTPVKPALA